MTPILARGWRSLGVAALVGIAHAQNFTGASADHSVGAWQAKAFEVDLHATADGTLANFHTGVDWPNLILVTPTPLPADNTLILPVHNTSLSVAEVFLRLGDDAAASWPDHAIAASVRLQPGQATNLLLPFVAHDPRALGMQVGPPPAGAPAAPMVRLDRPSGAVVAAHIKSLVITLWGQTGPRQLLLGTPRFAQLGWEGDSYDGLIDRYGQSSRTDWPERVHDDAELRTKAAIQTSVAAPGGLDRFGGVMAAHVAAPSGFFTLGHDRRGHAVFITPEGNAFYSLGVNSVATGDGATYVSGRERLFRDAEITQDGAHSGLGDDRSIHLAQHDVAFNHGRWFNFYTANLERRDGPAFAADWPSETLARLRNWGFNTVGNWSDPRLRAAATRLPYAVDIALVGAFATVTGPMDYWGPIADPFDARFAAAARASVARATAASRLDPYVIGDFVENELPWGNPNDTRISQRYAIAVETFALGPTSPAKRALLAALQTEYHEVEAFNRAWGLAVPSWDALMSRPPPLPEHLPPAAEADLQRFCAAFAERYYSTIKAAIAEKDPAHLYLGSRFASATPEAIAACARFCDVISINLYAADFGLAALGRLDKPVLVSEFSFGSSDRGPFSAGPVDVGTEDRRGVAYAAFARSALADARVVGLHWFQYLDEPASGRRLDGENAHFGLVSIADVPYRTLTDAARAANLAALDTLRQGASGTR